MSEVLKRPRLTSEAFRKNKITDRNLDHIREAVLDRAMAYILAAFSEIKKSNLLPTEAEMLQCLRATLVGTINQ